MDYIVTDYAINECEWVDLDEEDQSDETIVTAVKHKFVGWAMLGENESRKRGVFDEQEDTPLITSESNKRSLRS